MSIAETTDAPDGDILIASGKNKNTENFPVGSALIREDLRKHVHALYNFARAADDISDHPLLDAAEKVRRLDKFAAVLGDDASEEVPEAAALRRSIREKNITPQHGLDLLHAFKQDATKLRYNNWDELLDYCRYSASPVGRHVLALHGIGAEAWGPNDALCTALQIINHIQDCADDYRQLDRVYIPLDMLERSRAKIEDLAQEFSSPQLEYTLNAMLDAMEPMMIEARRIASVAPDWRLKCETSVIAVLADRLIRLLRRRDPLSENCKLSKFSVLTATISGVVRAWI